MNGHISVWFDAEAYNGRGVESEHKELTEALAELPVEPCENCAMITSCGIKQQSVKLFATMQALVSMHQMILADS